MQRGQVGGLPGERGTVVDHLEGELPVVLAELHWWPGSILARKGRRLKAPQRPKSAPIEGGAAAGAAPYPSTMATNTHTQKKWSARVMQKSDALDLEAGVFMKRSPHAIAESLKRSAEHSQRRKGTVYQSAMSMLNFYVNRAGKKLPAGRKRVLEEAKDALREICGRE